MLSIKSSTRFVFLPILIWGKKLDWRDQINTAYELDEIWPAGYKIYSGVAVIEALSVLEIFPSASYKKH
jgi:hypothetical protein